MNKVGGGGPREVLHDLGVGGMSAVSEALGAALLVCPAGEQRTEELDD